MAIRALDADPEAVSRIARIQPWNRWVTSELFSVRDALGRAGRDLQARVRFDCIYSLGLFDYLKDRVAARLMEWFWSLLNPGGSILIPNFHPETLGRGWLEAVMDWWLVYRTELGMAAPCLAESPNPRSHGFRSTATDPARSPTWKCGSAKPYRRGGLGAPRG